MERPQLRSKRLLDQLRERIRYAHYSLRTERTYVYWARYSFGSTGYAILGIWVRRKLNPFSRILRINAEYLLRPIGKRSRRFCIYIRKY
jgi:hypothetical protein